MPNWVSRGAYHEEIEGCLEHHADNEMHQADVRVVHGLQKEGHARDFGNRARRLRALAEAHHKYELHEEHGNHAGHVQARVCPKLAHGNALQDARLECQGALRRVRDNLQRKQRGAPRPHARRVLELVLNQVHIALERRRPDRLQLAIDVHRAVGRHEAARVGRGQRFVLVQQGLHALAAALDILQDGSVGAVAQRRVVRQHAKDAPHVHVLW